MTGGERPERPGINEAPATAGGPGSDGPGELFELPPELAIDTGVARRVIVGFIRGQLRQAGFDRIVIGLSGGIDSALVAYLSAEAVGPERLLAVLMPYRTSSPSSEADARTIVDRLGCASRLVEITAMVDGYFGTDGRPGALRVHGGGAGEAEDPGVEGAGAGVAGAGMAGAGMAGAEAVAAGMAGADASPVRRGNLMARMRMAVLYDLSAAWHGLVAGTGNKTESLIGYTTLFGDSACAFAPIGDLYKSQVRQLAVAVGVPEEIVRKAPSADLWPGQTDESEGAFSYPVIDRMLYWMVDRRRGAEELVAMGFERPMVERVERMVAASEFKRQIPPVAKLGPRTAGVDYLYPRRRPGSSANP